MKKSKFNYLTLGLVLSAIAADPVKGDFGAFDCSACTFDPFPVYLTDPCDDLVFAGGIAGFVVMNCDESFVSLSDPSEWSAKITAGVLRGRFNGCRIKGSIPAPDKVTKERGSCGQEEVVRKNYTVTLEDVQNDESNTAFDFYDFIVQNSGKYKVAFITCDARLYGFYSNVTISADEIVPDTDEDDILISSEFKFSTPRGLGLGKAVSLPFLATLPLQG